MLLLIQPGLTGLSVKRGFVFGQYRDMPIITARLLVATVTILRGKGAKKLMQATRGLCQSDEWLLENWPEVKQAKEEAAEHERQRLREEYDKRLEGLREDCARLSQQAMKDRGENHTLRQAIKIMQEDPS